MAEFVLSKHEEARGWEVAKYSDGTAQAETSHSGTVVFVYDDGTIGLSANYYEPYAYLTREKAYSLADLLREAVNISDRLYPTN